MKPSLPFFLIAVAAITQGVAVKPEGIKDPEVDTWLENIEPPPRKPNLSSESFKNGSCAANKPPAWPPDQRGTYDVNAKLVINSDSKSDSGSRRLLKRNQIESFYCGSQKKDDHGPEIGYGYTRYQVEQAFKDAEVFLRFWEPQKGVNLRSASYPQLLGVKGDLFINEPNVPEFCKDKDAYLYEYPILRGNTCDMKPRHFRGGDYAPGPDRVIMAADKKSVRSKQENEDLFRTARIKACTVATFQDQHDLNPLPTAKLLLTPCSLYKYDA